MYFYFSLDRLVQLDDFIGCTVGQAPRAAPPGIDRLAEMVHVEVRAEGVERTEGQVVFVECDDGPGRRKEESKGIIGRWCMRESGGHGAGRRAAVVLNGRVGMRWQKEMTGRHEAPPEVELDGTLMVV